MCIAYPMKIISLKGDEAVCEYDGVKSTVNISLVPDLSKGDYVIVHTGFALEKVNLLEARKILRLHKKVLLKKP